MLVTDIIARKRDGRALDDDQIRTFIAGATDGSIPDYQVAALLMAIVLRGLEPRELTTWTDAMLHSGAVLDLSTIDGIKVDKHSTGGVGDKISLPLAPLVAAAGVPVPMISGRGLGHTGGTLDKLEAIPGFRTNLPLDRFRDILADLGCCIIGQTDEIAPADRRLYALRDVTATVESIPLIASSILSKKLAEGIDALVLDVKTGSGAFLPDPVAVRTLAETMVAIGARAGKRVVALLTNMDQPLGTHIGNALEVDESIRILQGAGPDDSRELTLALGIEMLRLGGVEADPSRARARLEALLNSGAALERFARMIEAQGGDPRVCDDPHRLPKARDTSTLVAPRDGFLTAFDCAAVGRAALLLGAGRARKEDPVDPAAGIVLHHKVGDAVVAGEPLATLHHGGAGNHGEALARLAAAIRIGDQPPAPLPLVFDRIEGDPHAPTSLPDSR